MKLTTIQKDTILWVKTITAPTQIAAVILIIEDKNEDVMTICLYNQIDRNKKFIELLKIFPAGVTIGIKQPYLNVSYNGNYMLRNDNP